MLKCTEKHVKFKILLISLFFYSCTNNLAVLSLVSTQDVDLKSRHENVGLVKGEHQIPHIWFFPLGEINKIDKAIDNTLKKNNIDYLTDVNVDHTLVHFYFFGLSTIKVEGVGWKIIEVKYDPLTGEPTN
jgi:hypothetical protein